MNDMKVKKYKLYDIIEIEISNRNLIKKIANCVTCIMLEKKFSCSYLMFEFSGVLCAHMLKVLIALQIHCILAHYILKY